MNKEIKVGDKVRVRSTTVPKGYNFTYAFGIGSIGKVIQNLGYKDSRCVMVKFGDKVTERESYYEDDLDVLEDNTEEIEEKSNFEDMGYEIAQAYFEFYKGIAKALTEKEKKNITNQKILKDKEQV